MTVENKSTTLVRVSAELHEALLELARTRNQSINEVIWDLFMGDDDER